MRVLMLGAGRAGRALAAKLCQERHDIVLVDIRSEPLAEVQKQLDILTIHGDASDLRVLEQAEVARADMVVAVTDRDPINLLACSMARATGVGRTVACVSDPNYLHPPPHFDLKKLGIDLIVSQKEECAREMYNLLRMPGTLEAVDLLDGRLLAVGVRVHMDSPLLRSTLRAFPEPERLNAIRFIALNRGGKLSVPHGDTRFMVGDDIYFVGRPPDVAAFMAWAWPERSSFSKIIIAGGGELGLCLAQLLEAANLPTVLIEKNEDRATYCSGVLHRTLVIKGDTLDSEVLKTAGIVGETAYAAVTNSDEHNIIGCLLAADLKARFTLAQVAKPEYVPIINNMSLLDRAVSPPLSLINAILHFIRGRHARDAVVFQNLPGEMLDTVLPRGHRWVGKAVKDLRIPVGVLIAAILRDDEVTIATGSLVLAEGDRVVLFATPEARANVSRLFRA